MSNLEGPVITSNMANFVQTNKITAPITEKRHLHIFDFFACFLSVSNIIFPLCFRMFYKLILLQFVSFVYGISVLFHRQTKAQDHIRQTPDGSCLDMCAAKINYNLNLILSRRN